jgi:hypothetical protein
MSLATEIFGEGVWRLTLDGFKEAIKKLPPTLREKKSYLLKDYAKIRGILLTTQDFVDVGG